MQVIIFFVCRSLNIWLLRSPDFPQGIIRDYETWKWDVVAGWVIIRGLCRMLDFLNALYTPQQLGNRTLPRVRLEPRMASVERLRQVATTSIRAFRKS